MASVATSISVNALSRTLMRSLMRAARRLDRIVSPSAVPAELARFPAPSSGFGSLQGLSFAGAVKHAFRAHRFFAASTPAGKKQLNSLQDMALAALQMANKRASALTSGAASAAAADAAAPSAAAAAAAPARPATVAFSVGQVFVHRQFGYRGVIVGWDASCRAGSEWLSATGTARLPHGAAQPFYHVLVDVRDRPDAQVSYVAQDNIVLLTPAAVKATAAAAAPAGALPASPAAAAAARNTGVACLVVHPSAAAYLKEYLPAAGRYVPAPALAAAYPHDDAATVAASALPMLSAAAAAATAPASAVVPLSPSAAAAAAAAASRARAVVSPSLVGRSGRDGSFAAAAARLASLRASGSSARHSAAAAALSASSSASSGSESEGEGRAGLARLA